ncbi:MAG TPA: histidine kinase [Gryllotalpicola sp.]
MRTLTGRQLGLDAAVAAAFALVCFVLLYMQDLAGFVSRGHFVPMTVIAGALVFRRLMPGLALAVAWLGALLQLVVGLDPQIYDIGICAVLYATAAHGGRVVRWLGLVSAVLGAALASVYLIGRLRWFGGLDYVPLLFPGQARDFAVLGFGILTLLVLSWVSGLLSRSLRLSRATSRREELARRDADIAEYRVVVEQERNRIARDMHDVVAHSLAVVIAQADGARFAASARPELAVDALATISGVARDALGDVRMLLAELRHDEGATPQPSLVDLDQLFEQLRGAGLSLEVHESGFRQPLGASHEIAAYRIIQEGLTNALRHGAPGAPVGLSLFWADDGLHVEIANTMRPVGDTGPVAGRGHGLPGMHERAQLAGGFLTAEPDGDGGFRLRTRIPRIATTTATATTTTSGAVSA